jgi:hypothetical protein
VLWRSMPAPGSRPLFVSLMPEEMAATHTLFGSPKAHEMKERDTVEAPECGDAKRPREKSGE